jgi:hypothetical protein
MLGILLRTNKRDNTSDHFLSAFDMISSEPNEFIHHLIKVFHAMWDFFKELPLGREIIKFNVFKFDLDHFIKGSELSISTWHIKHYLIVDYKLYFVKLCDSNTYTSCSKKSFWTWATWTLIWSMWVFTNSKPNRSGYCSISMCYFSIKIAAKLWYYIKGIRILSK